MSSYENGTYEGLEVINNFDNSCYMLISFASSIRHRTLHGFSERKKWGSVNVYEECVKDNNTSGAITSQN